MATVYSSAFKFLWDVPSNTYTSYALLLKWVKCFLQNSVARSNEKLPLMKPSPQLCPSPEPFQGLVVGFPGGSGKVPGSSGLATASAAWERRCRVTEGVSGTWLRNSHCYFLLSFLIGNSCHLFPSHPSAVLAHTQSPAPVPPSSSGWVPHGCCRELVGTRSSWVLRCCWQRCNTRSAQAAFHRAQMLLSPCCFNCDSLSKLHGFFNSEKQ